MTTGSTFVDTDWEILSDQTFDPSLLDPDCPAPDTTAPVITPPANVTVDTDPGQPTAAVSFSATALDDVDGAVPVTANPVSGSSFNVGTTTVDLTATDAAGNTGTSSFTVTVNDNEAPMVVAPADINVPTDPGSSGAVVTFMAIATDNVGVQSQIASPASGSVFPVGTTLVTITATDAAGNSTQATFNVTVEDMEDPVITPPADITVSTDPGQPTAVVNFMAGVTDNVGVTSQSASPSSGSTFPLGTTQVTINASDAAGNTSQEMFNVTVEDNEAPVVTAPADITVNVDPGTSGAVVNFTLPDATDNVDPDFAPAVADSSPTMGLDSGSTFPVGTTTLTVQGTDTAGNVATAQFTVTVTDDEAPVITPPADIVVNNDPGQDFAVVTFFVTDAVDAVDGAVPVIANPASGSTFPVGTTTVNMSALDSGGNTGTGSFTVTVNDNEAPIVVVPADITVSTDPGQSTAVVNFTPASADNVGVVSQSASPMSGTPFPVGTTVVTVTATDAAGNSSQGTFNVTVEDNEAPVITTPANVNVPTDPGVATAVVTFPVTANDAVDGAITPTVTSSPTAGLTSGSAFPIGITTITLDAMDSEGNAAQAQFTVTVTNTGPSFTSPNTVSVPENQTDVIDVEVNDDSDSEGNGITYALTTLMGGDDNGFFSIDPATGVITFNAPPDFEMPGDASMDNDYLVQVTATDSGGETSTQDITVTVTDGPDGATVEETQAVISEFMLNRANNMLNNQVSLIEFVTGNNVNGGGDLGYLAINGNEGGQTFRFTTSRSKIAATRDAATRQRLNEAFGVATGLTPATPEVPLRKTASLEERFNPVGATNTHDTRMDQAYGFDATTTGIFEENATALANDGLIDTQAADDIALPSSRAGEWDLWMEISGSLSEAGTSEADFVVGYVGAHVFISDYTLVGILGQIDWSEETNPAVNSRADGVGWMVGPYIAGQIPGQNLAYEARVAYGTSDNTVSPIGTYTDDFDTTRFLASAKVTGTYKYDTVTISPSTSISWFEETQEAYTDSNAQFIPEQTVSLGEVRFGPSISQDFVLDDGTVFTPSIGIEGVYNFGISNNAASQGFALGDDDVRARVDAGFTATDTAGLILMISGFYDGIGVDDYQSYGGQARVTIPLN